MDSLLKLNLTAYYIYLYVESLLYFNLVYQRYSWHSSKRSPYSFIFRHFRLP